VAHVEAGLRSFNETSMEEVNRRVAASTCHAHFAPTGLAAGHLRSEGVAADRIFVVGNPVLDSLVQLGYVATPVATRSGAVMTAHRASNVDDPSRLRRIVEIAGGLAAMCGEVSFPVHPRTRGRLREFGMLARLEASGVEILEPLPYDEMMHAVARSQVVVTDSGGIQEEAAWFGVPTVVLRQSTPRWEGVHAGIARLCGLETRVVLEAAAQYLEPDEQLRVSGVPCPYGDGTAGLQIAEILSSPVGARLLTLTEPALVPARHPERTL